MLHQPIKRLLITTTLPMVPAILLLMGFDLLESFLIAKSGTTDMAALAFAMPLTTMMTAIAVAVSIATNHIVCHTGTHNLTRLKKEIISTLILSVGTILLLSLVAKLGSEALFIRMGVDYVALPESFHMGPRPDMLPIASGYTDIRLYGWIFILLVWQVNGILRSLGHLKVAGILMSSWLASKSLAILLLLDNQALVLPFSDLKISAFIHFSIDAVFTLVSLLCMIRILDLRVSDCRKLPISNTVLRKLRIFLPAATQQSFTPVAIGVMTAMVVAYGAGNVALMGIIFRIEAIALLLPMVFTTSVPTIVAVNWWSGHNQRVVTLMRFAFASVLITQLLVALALHIFAAGIADYFFALDPIREDLIFYLKWVPLSFIGAGWAILAVSSFNSVGWTFDSNLLSFSHRLLLTLSCSYIGLLVYDQKGLILGISLAHCLAAFLTLYLTNQHRFYNNQLTSVVRATSI